VVLLLFEPARAAEPPTHVSCEACVVVDGDGRTLWSRVPHTPLPPASTTKMATALVVTREAGLEEEVTVSTAAAATGGGGLDLLAGDRYSVKDLLYALLMTSSNDAAVALAEHTSGSEEVFVDAMNQLLAELGATDSTFLTPHGLDAPGHVSSPADLAVMADRVLENPVLAPIVATSETTISGSRGPQYLENRNVLLETYKGATGVKTGMTALAGNVLVAAAERRGDVVIAVAMRSFDATADARAMLDYGFNRLRREIVLDEGEVVTEIVLDPMGSVPVSLGSGVRLFAPAGVEMTYVIDEELPADTEAGDVIGRLRIVSEGQTLATAPLHAGEAVEDVHESLLARMVQALLALASGAGRSIGIG
jgi:serine-type D-Ala-D-Ala carboxypeptidase (penicillin-binding protein 5/6)